MHVRPTDPPTRFGCHRRLLAQRRLIAELNPLSVGAKRESTDAFGDTKTELLISAQTDAVIRQVADKVDYTIIGAAPLLPAADDAEVAAPADATLVVHRGKSTREQAARSYRPNPDRPTTPGGRQIDAEQPGAQPNAEEPEARLASPDPQQQPARAQSEE